MAEFTLDNLPSGGASPGGKKKKNTKIYLYVGGAVVIMLYIVFIKRTQPAASVDTASVNYPTNSVDVASQLQNNNDILQGNVNAALNQFQAQLNTDYGTQLNAIQQKMDKFQTQVESLTAHPNPTQTPAPAPTTPAPASTAPAAPAPAAPAKPSWTSSLSRASYAQPRGGWNSGSVVDYLKSKGYAADFASRQRLAGAMGITGYSGTVGQNIALLNNLKSAGV